MIEREPTARKPTIKTFDEWDHVLCRKGGKRQDHTDISLRREQLTTLFNNTGVEIRTRERFKALQSIGKFRRIVLDIRGISNDHAKPAAIHDLLKFSTPIKAYQCIPHKHIKVDIRKRKKQAPFPTILWLTNVRNEF